MKLSHKDKIGFDSEESLDAFLSRFFPERKCTDTPGFYKVKNGYIGVFCNEITFYAN